MKKFKKSNNNEETKTYSLACQNENPKYGFFNVYYFVETAYLKINC